MNLTKAIERGSDSLKHNTILYTQADKAALALLIEAGKRETECREGAPPEDWCLLPGETLA